MKPEKPEHPAPVHFVRNRRKKKNKNQETQTNGGEDFFSADITTKH